MGLGQVWEACGLLGPGAAAVGRDPLVATLLGIIPKASVFYDKICIRNVRPVENVWSFNQAAGYDEVDYGPVAGENLGFRDVADTPPFRT